MQIDIQRSMMILPVHIRRFVEKAHLRGADAIVLDMEDAVPAAEKENARRLVPEAIALVSRGGADVLVRVNNEPELLGPDLAAAVCPGLHAVFLPKTEIADDVRFVEQRISGLERERGIEPGSVKISLHIESPRALLKIVEIVSAGSRIESVSIGVDDYCLQMGVEPSAEASELFLAFSMMATACKAFGVNPIGVLGTVATFQDTVGSQRAPEMPLGLGSTGGYCVHPGQVTVLNQVFTPAVEKVEHARRVIAAYEDALKQGKGAISLDGRMVDAPIYKQSRRIAVLADAIAARERRKAQALARIA